MAAGLRRGRVGTFGFAYANRLSYAFEDPVAVELLAGIASVAEDAGAGLALLPGSATPKSRVAALTGAVIDGLIVNSLAADDPLLVTAIARRLPLAVIDQPDPEQLAALGAPASPWIEIDDRVVAAAIAEHVISLGHRRLGVVSFGLHRRPRRGLVDQRAQAAATYAVTRRRLAGYRDAALRADLDWNQVPVVQGTDSTVAEGEAAAATALAAQPRPTALLCLSDRLAEGALRTAARLGLSVPADLSVAGFDDAPHAAGLNLTTVRQPHRRKGALAARALLGVLDGSPAEDPQSAPGRARRPRLHRAADPTVVSAVDPGDERPPLSALLSQVFVAFTIECDNEFEHQMPHRTTRHGSTPGATDTPWLISMAMWAHCLRHVPEDGIAAGDLARRARLSRHSAQLILKRMSRRSWGYLEISPVGRRPSAAPARGPRVVRLTPAGRRAQRMWEPLAEAITARWGTRFGEDNVAGLRSALAALAAELGVGAPDFVPITELAGDMRAGAATARAPSASSRDVSLPALLSKPLVAFAGELERTTGLSPVLSANVVRVLGDEGVPAPRLSALTGIADMGIENSLSALARRGYVEVGRDPARGPDQAGPAHGPRASGCARRISRASRRSRGSGRRAAAGRACARCGPPWRAWSAAVPRRDSPLFVGLAPYPDGWRAEIAPRQTLPHYPFVSHRGGFPDGS